MLQLLLLVSSFCISGALRKAMRWHKTCDHAHYPNNLEALNFDFTVCANRGPCDKVLPSRWKGDLLKHVDVDSQVRVANHTPAILHIGGAGFGAALDFPGMWIDSDLYNGLDARGKVRFTLVEAVPENVYVSQQHIKSLLNLRGSSDVLNGFVDDDCTNKHFYGMDMARASKDFGIPNRSNPSWASMSKEEVRNAWEFNRHTFREMLKRTGQSEEAFLRAANLSDDTEKMEAFLRAANFSDYIVPLPVPCLTPSKLLETLNVKPEELAMVVLDIEGADMRVMNAFLDIPAFRPAFLQIETGDCVETHNILNKMKDHGYSVGHERFVNEQRTSIEDNVVGVLSQVLA